MRERVLSYIRKHGLMRPGDRVAVAVSGGADSVALLRLLLDARAELGIVLSVVHFNHKIRGADADADEQFVRELARGFELEFFSESADTPGYAREHKMSLEAAGRKLRYAYFDRVTGDSTVHRVATAHTRDDQAETVLMRFLRGSGTKGLAGIYPGIGGRFEASEKDPHLPKAGKCGAPSARIVRPLLEVTRAELRAYLEKLGQGWREDASNADVGFTRNRLRHEIMPLLRQINPNLDQVLSETAEVSREEEKWWSIQISEAQEDLWAPPESLRDSTLAKPAGVGHPSAGVGEPRHPEKLRVDILLTRPVAVQRRLIRVLLETRGVQVGLEHVEAVRLLAEGEASRGEKVVELPHGWEAVRAGGELWFRSRCESKQEQREYDCALTVPGEVQVADRKIRAELVRNAHARARVPHGSETRATHVLLDAELAKAQQGLRVRNWRAGDRYWPAHTKEPKKLKELLQARHIPREQKPYWPVVVVAKPTSAKDGQLRGTQESGAEEIIWVPGFDEPERFRVRDDASEALLLESSARAVR